MKIIKNHFNEQHTLFIRDKIINGCQTFTIDEIDKVCREYFVPEDVKQETIKMYNSDVEHDLINDDDWKVRLEVAKQGQSLDELVYDEDFYVRKEVAKQGYGLDILMSDKASAVREQVAKQGYGLDILMHDKEFIVRHAAKRKAKHSSSS